MRQSQRGHLYQPIPQAPKYPAQLSLHWVCSEKNIMWREVRWNESKPLVSTWRPWDPSSARSTALDFAQALISWQQGACVWTNQKLCQFKAEVRNQTCKHDQWSGLYHLTTQILPAHHVETNAIGASRNRWIAWVSFMAFHGFLNRSTRVTRRSVAVKPLRHWLPTLEASRAWTGQWYIIWLSSNKAT